MLPNVRVLTINRASDGTGAVPTNVTSMVRCDGYFREKIAERWAKDRGLALPGIVYQLDRLPVGYAGFEKKRESTKHIDRFVYGHPRGYFRSINELYPHFQHLQDFSSAAGCPCKLCTGTQPKRDSDAGSSGPGSDSAAKSTGKNSAVPVAKPKSTGLQSEYFGRRLPPNEPDPTPRRKQVDDCGTPDIYRALLDKLQAEGPDGQVNESIVDMMSPDWMVGHETLMKLLDEFQSLPDYVPRTGELVLFNRSALNGPLQQNHSSPNPTAGAFGRSEWNVGVVTQMPIEPITVDDLSGVSDRKKHAVTYSGFRVEPLSEPNSRDKSITKQHKYVPLHMIRPFCFWQECAGDDPADWHPTVKHAITVASSFCIVGRYSFKGTWPDATVFARGVYLGAELILVGDTVRILPRASRQPAAEAVTDIMVVSSIRLRIVNLDAASDDDYDQGAPYNTCLHISGRAFTQDRTRSFDGTGATVSGLSGVPASLAGHGQGPWYPIADPANPQSRLELPYTRVLGRCFDPVAVRSWGCPPGPGRIATDARDNTAVRLAAGHDAAVSAARSYSAAHDPRIDRAHGKTWFWADSRIEQLDLHEVNGRYVAGPRATSRSPRQMLAWRRALQVLDGGGGGRLVGGGGGTSASSSSSAFAAPTLLRREDNTGHGPRPQAHGMVAAHVPQRNADTERNEAESDSDDDDDSAAAMDVDDADSPPHRAAPPPAIWIG